ncbi:MAG: sigma 54-interacting transcriptional regulator, partial [Myxococcales bacterium]|nr:sigma 54-interacting transcriptional regulator [Myxococcales bacterium]
RRRKGLFEAAHTGTLFLDEIGEISLATQAKLLRALESKQIVPLGTNEAISVDVRILCATHRDLEAAVKAGTFREDLFYRVSAFSLTLPPLRERPLELRLLSERFIRAFSERDGKPPVPLTEAAGECLRASRWPGNIRELRNAIEHAVLMAEGRPIERQHLPARLLAAPARGASRAPRLGVKEEIEDLERGRIEQALADHKGSRTRAAQALGMSRRALIYKLHKHGLG